MIRALGIMLSEWCCSVSIVGVQILSRENTNLSAQKFNSNTVGKIFRRIHIWKVRKQHIFWLKYIQNCNGQRVGLNWGPIPTFRSGKTITEVLNKSVIDNVRRGVDPMFKLKLNKIIAKCCCTTGINIECWRIST